MTKTDYICTLPEQRQTEIKNKLLKIIPENEIDTAMNGRICDIEELLLL